MASKFYSINKLYKDACKEISTDIESWQGFLLSAGRNFKLRFDEQVLVYAQRPDATAVLTIEKWNGLFRRWVNKGARGIAVFDDGFGENQRLKYYFDVSDTHEGTFSEAGCFREPLSQSMTLQIGCISGDLDDMSDLKSTGDPFNGL